METYFTSNRISYSKNLYLLKQLLNMEPNLTVQDLEKAISEVEIK